MNKKTIGIEYIDVYMRFPEIMEEEFDDLLEFLKDEHIRCEGATDVFIDLQRENQKQKEVIDRIKEYILRSEVNSIGTPFAYTQRGKDLLDILKEVTE